MCKCSCPQQAAIVNFIALCCVIHTYCQSRCFLTAKWGYQSCCWCWHLNPSLPFPFFPFPLFPFPHLPFPSLSSLPFPRLPSPSHLFPLIPFHPFPFLCKFLGHHRPNPCYSETCWMWMLYVFLEYLLCCVNQRWGPITSELEVLTQ